MRSHAISASSAASMRPASPAGISTGSSHSPYIDSKSTLSASRSAGSVLACAKRLREAKRLGLRGRAVVISCEQQAYLPVFVVCMIVHIHEERVLKVFLHQFPESPSPS